MSDVLARLRLAGRNWPPVTSALLGEFIQFEALFTALNGAAVEVTGVTAYAYRPPLEGEPTGTTPIVTMTRVGVGVWLGTVSLDRVGDWALHAQCAAPSVAVARADLRVTLGGPEALEEPRAGASAAASAGVAVQAANAATGNAGTADAAAAAAVAARDVVLPAADQVAADTIQAGLDNAATAANRAIVDLQALAVQANASSVASLLPKPHIRRGPLAPILPGMAGRAERIEADLDGRVIQATASGARFIEAPSGLSIVVNRAGLDETLAPIRAGVATLRPRIRRGPLAPRFEGTAANATQVRLDLDGRVVQSAEPGVIYRANPGGGLSPLINEATLDAALVGVVLVRRGPRAPLSGFVALAAQGIKCDLDGRVYEATTARGVLFATSTGLASPTAAAPTSAVPTGAVSALDAQVLNAVGNGVTTDFNIAAMLHQPRRNVRPYVNGTLLSSPLSAWVTDDIFRFSPAPANGAAVQFRATNGLRRPLADDVIYFGIVWGQSLAAGQVSLTASALATAALYPSNVLMPSSGVRLNGNPFSSLVPLVETPSAVTTSGLKETVSSGFAAHLARDIQLYTGWMPTIAMMVAADGGRSIAEIGPGSTILDGHLLTGVDSLIACAAALGKRAACIGVLAVHGQEDARLGMTRAGYATAADRLRDYLDHTIRARTQQAEPIRIYWAQPNEPDDIAPAGINAPGLAMLDLHGLGRHHVMTGTSSYDMDTSDGTHLTSADYNLLGQRMARAVLQDGFGQGWDPVMPDGAGWWESATEYVQPYRRPRDRGAITLDTSGTIIGMTGITTGKGYAPIARAGSAGSLTSVVTEGVDRVRFTWASRPTGHGLQLRYAMYRSGVNNRLTGARGCLRLDDGDTPWRTSLYGLGVSYDWAPSHILNLPIPPV